MMRAGAAFVPTRRELLLLVGLLFVLLFVAQSDYLSTSVSVTQVQTTEDDERIIRYGTYPEPKFTWTDSVPETKLVAHAAGWTILDKLYAMNGTLYIVTSDREAYPDLRLITSSGYEIWNGEEERAKRVPTDKDIQLVSPTEAQRIFGIDRRSATRMDGVNFMCTDPKQFITHYYHWTAELMFGLWRAYSSLDTFISADGHTRLPPPKRMLFRHVGATSWRDYAAMNEWVTRGAFPSIGMEFSEDWQDRAKMGMPFVMERVVLADRGAANEGLPYKATWRTASNAFDLPGSPHWWTPIRRSVLEFSGLSPDWIQGPDLDTPARADNQRFVITYVSRQDWGRRMLRQKDHEKLVEELYKLRDKYGYEVNVVAMDKLSRTEQLQLAGRTTIMMGVHGNGLTSLVWMRPSPRATVIEFFYPKGLAFDYEYTTRALGMRHYGVWDNLTFTRPNVPQWPNYLEGFQGNDIPLDGAIVARLVHKRLTLEQDDTTEDPEEITA